MDSSRGLYNYIGVKVHVELLFVLTYSIHKTLTVDVVAHDQSAYVLSASNFNPG